MLTLPTLTVTVRVTNPANPTSPNTRYRCEYGTLNSNVARFYAFASNIQQRHYAFGYAVWLSVYPSSVFHLLTPLLHVWPTRAATPAKTPRENSAYAIGWWTENPRDVIGQRRPHVAESSRSSAARRKINSKILWISDKEVSLWLHMIQYLFTYQRGDLNKTCHKYSPCEWEWASCLINLWAFCRTPWICNFINSLISWVPSFTESYLSGHWQHCTVWKYHFN